MLSSINKLNNKNYINFFIIFYLISYIAGPAVINIFVTLLSFFSLFYIFINRFNFKLIFNDKSTIIFCLFFIYFFFKSFFYLDFNFEIISFLRYVILFLGISLYAKLNKSIFNFKINYLVFLLLFGCVDTIFQYYFGFNTLGYEKYTYARLTSFFEDEPIVGSFIMKLIFPIFVYLLLENKKKFLLITITFISSISVILSGERMPFLQLLFGFCIFFIFFFKLNFKNFITFVFVGFISIFILLSQGVVKERYSASLLVYIHYIPILKKHLSLRNN